MAVSDVADVELLGHGLNTIFFDSKLTRDKDGNPGLNVRGITDAQLELLHFMRNAKLINRWKMKVKRSGTGLRVTFYKD